MTTVIQLEPPIQEKDILWLQWTIEFASPNVPIIERLHCVQYTYCRSLVERQGRIICACK